MSLVPYLFDLDPWEYRGRRWSDWDHFGLGITPYEIQSLVEFPRRIMSQLERATGDLSPAQIGKDGFQACIDVKQFKPNEITVKTVNNDIVVEGKHEERQDEHGYISRQFTRRYRLPKGYDPAKVVSTLSSDGVLTLKAPPPKEAIENNERVVQIQQTGPAHVNVKENPKEEETKGKKK